MPYAFFSGMDVKSIIKTLPDEQIRHMSHVGIFVSKFTKLIFRSNPIIQNGNVHSKYFGKAAFYHDLGKACIPAKLLTKPGRLTEEEFCIIKKHPAYARELFKMAGSSIYGIPEHLIPFAYDAAVYHHEWWNGQGYPYGRSYQDIPLIARITSVCDAYDAMTSDRVYRRARTHDEACRELEVNAGTQFEPILIKEFLDNQEEFFLLSKRFSDINCIQSREIDL